MSMFDDFFAPAPEVFLGVGNAGIYRLIFNVKQDLRFFRIFFH